MSYLSNNLLLFDKSIMDLEFGKPHQVIYVFVILLKIKLLPKIRETMAKILYYAYDIPILFLEY